MITPEAQIARYSIAELIKSADDYFSGVECNNIVMRKPFDHPSSAGMLAALAAMIQGSDLRPRDVVVDFGCGTAWLSRIFAYFGCHVHAIDVSPQALKAGERLFATDPYFPKCSVEFHAFDGENIPLPAHSVDRIFCNASFHHVWNQEKILSEFFRVLKPGGMAAFHEPGPGHAYSSQSQMEMRDYKVIENNIVVENIDASAQRLGFHPMKLAFFFPWAEFLSIEEFNQMLSGTAAPDATAQMLGRAAGRFENLRVFLLPKPGASQFDSRVISHRLRSKLTLLSSDYSGPELEYHILVENIGEADWLPSCSGIGEVNLGAHLYSDNSLVNLDYLRAVVSTDVVRLGQSRTLHIKVPRPTVPNARLVFDLVAEGVTWFENANNSVLRVDLF